MKNVFKNKLGLKISKTKNSKFRKQIGLSILSGTLIFIATIYYSNTSFTLKAEEGMNEKVSILKYSLFKPKIDTGRQCYFINTGYDLTSVWATDTSLGDTVITNRSKILKFIKYLNTPSQRPKLIVIDIALNRPYFNSKIDTLDTTDTPLAKQLKKLNSLLIVFSKDGTDNIVRPLPVYDSIPSGLAKYETYGYILDKFKLTGEAGLPTIPRVMNEILDSAKYKSIWGIHFCNGHLCFNTVWPDYYYSPDTSGLPLEEELSSFSKNQNMTNYKDKIVFIGNLNNDQQQTSLGELSGPMILANAYLSIKNKHHYVDYIWLLIIIFLFSGLSYYSWFKKLPEIKISHRSYYADKLLKKILLNWWGFVNWGTLSLVFITSALFFDIYVSLIFPGIIFTFIEFFSTKKS